MTVIDLLGQVHGNPFGALKAQAAIPSHRPDDFQSAE